MNPAGLSAQVHFEDGWDALDGPGLDLTLTPAATPFSAGVLSSASSFVIPPGQDSFQVDVALQAWVTARLTRGLRAGVRGTQARRHAWCDEACLQWSGAIYGCLACQQNLISSHRG